MPSFLVDEGFPLGSHFGIVAVRLPNDIPVLDRVATIVRALTSLGELELRGNLVIVEQDRVRLRSPVTAGE